MRPLRPARLLALSSGLWALDAVQPVAAVLDPRTGSVRDLVSWPQVPAEPVPAPWPPPRVLPDGASFWTQPSGDAPLVRIGTGGLELAVWTQGLRLAAVGPSGVWCAPPPPPQDVVRSADGRPEWGLQPSQLLHVTPGGLCRRTSVGAPVRSVQAEEAGLFVALDAEPWHLQPLGADLYEVVWSLRWLRVPWDADLGDELLDVAEEVPADSAPEVRTGDGRGVQGSWHNPWDDAGDRHALHLEGARWGFGWRPDGHAAAAGRAVALTHRADGSELHRTDLGPGTVTSTVLVGPGVGDAVAVAVRRDSPGALTPPAEVLSISRGGEVSRLLAADAVDVTAHCRPLPAPPPEAGSYLRQVLGLHGNLLQYWRTDSGPQPLVEGLSAVRTRLLGDWPETLLEWSFEHPGWPGVRLRRRIPLFDEFGRITPPDQAAVVLREDLEIGAVPGVESARAGFVDF